MSLWILGHDSQKCIMILHDNDYVQTYKTILTWYEWFWSALMKYSYKEQYFYSLHTCMMYVWRLLVLLVRMLIFSCDCMFVYMCLCVYVCVLNMHCVGCCMQSVCVIQVSIYDCICCCKRTAKNVFSFSASVRKEAIIYYVLRLITLF